MCFFLEKKIFNSTPLLHFITIIIIIYDVVHALVLRERFSERLGEASHRLCQVQGRVVRVNVQVVLPAGATHGALSLSQP